MKRTWTELATDAYDTFGGFALGFLVTLVLGIILFLVYGLPWGGG